MPAPFTRKLPDRRIESVSEPGLALVALLPRDLALIRRWLAEPHVACWWNNAGEGSREIARHLDDDHVAPFLTVESGRPIGYLQIYHANDEPFWAAHELPRETFGLDLFIGESDRVGHGLGPAFIRLATARLLEVANVARIHIDPDPSNARAIKAYEKAGFHRRGLIHTPDGPALYMAMDR